MKNYFEILQVSPNAPMEVIEAAYKALVKNTHPDQNSSPSANSDTSLLNEAIAFLRVEGQRLDLQRRLRPNGVVAVPVNAPSSPDDALLVLLFGCRLTPDSGLDPGVIRDSLASAGFNNFEIAAALERVRRAEQIELQSDYNHGDWYSLTTAGVDFILGESDRLSAFQVPVVREEPRPVTPEDLEAIFG